MGFSLSEKCFEKEEKPMFNIKIDNQRILEINLGIYIDAFLTDSKAAGLARTTLFFYSQRLKPFLEYCNSQQITSIEQITPDFIRRYILYLQENHNPGGVHTFFRALRAFFYWAEFEELIEKNPIKKVKAPKVDLPPLSPISLDDVNKLLQVSNERDKAVFLFLLDTGLGAGELLALNVIDVALDGAVIITKSKSHKPRTVFICRKTRRVLRAYLRTRQDNCTALFVTKFGDRLSYMGLREILRRRMQQAGVKTTLHSFRRAFCSNMLRNGVDIYSLKKLVGHADLSVMQRYLQQTNFDTRRAHELGSPVEGL